MIGKRYLQSFYVDAVSKSRDNDLLRQAAILMHTSHSGISLVRLKLLIPAAYDGRLLDP